MSIVHPLLDGAAVLDLCAGSGALGLEALSRGAARATFVESGERSLRALRANVDALGASERATIVRADAERFASRLAERAFDVAFADPPYASGTAVSLVTRWLQVPFARVFGVEHSARVTVPGGVETRRYGDTAITFYRADDPTE
jgi:16S rRNA (guanine966-N2)-methyltransferase